ncbi:MAG: bacillithiol biosynthesis deacetylase BshB1 [Candidatus Cohnella colombiensis]|uniref:Bacillithiol biosynthesis deacetylase BshB1 n=1 Tax=Candidatus Cohnella colombiensis TaxID=3121368 RepID=A0AA95EZD5_9BACL|nr:MAG: bacillithiol biosynthesis deacetylase BshB1 [Cohnella sp.]
MSSDRTVERVKLDILVFAAHPDDAEIGMGGTIIKHSRDGMRIGIIDLTYAELSSNGDVDTRQQEAALASDRLGLSVRGNLGLPDRGLSIVPDQIDRVMEAIRYYQPRLVFAPYSVDRHPDHIACSRIVQEAVFNAKLRRYQPETEAWTVDQLLFYMINDFHTPQMLVDISDVLEQKMDALKAYRSQFMPDKLLADWVDTPLTGAYLDAVVARDQLFGATRRLAYAEGFIAAGPIVMNRL